VTLPSRRSPVTRWGRSLAQEIGTAAVGGLAVLCVALAALLAVAVPGTAGVNGAERRAVLEVATEGVTSVFSYDYRHLQADFQRAEVLLTPRMRRDYSIRATQLVRSIALKYHGIVTMQVIQAGISSASLTRAQVLVFGQQVGTSDLLAAPRLDKSHVLVTVVRRGGRWLVDNLQPV
jgi:Mce-associated membrane protein